MYVLYKFKFKNFLVSNLKEALSCLQYHILKLPVACFNIALYCLAERKTKMLKVFKAKKNQLREKSD